MNISKIREIREDKDLSQSDIAKLLKTTQQQYSKYELGKINIPVEMLEKLADYYNVSVDYLLGRTKNKDIP